MLELPGSLERATLGDVLGALHRDRVTGALRVEELDGHVHVIHWHDGLIHHVETTRSAPPRSASGFRFDAARRYSPANDPKHEHLARLEAMFHLSRARLSFRVMGKRPVQAAEPLGPREFLHGRRRSRDVGGGRGRPSAHAPPPPRPSVPPAETARERALQTLGLSGEPGPEAVRAAFRQLARRWHPDRHPHAGERTRAALCRHFVQISAAYEQLMAQSA